MVSRVFQIEINMEVHLNNIETIIWIHIFDITYVVSKLIKYQQTINFQTGKILFSKYLYAIRTKYFDFHTTVNITITWYFTVYLYDSIHNAKPFQTTKPFDYHGFRRFISVIVYSHTFIQLVLETQKQDYIYTNNGSVFMTLKLSNLSQSTQPVPMLISLSNLVLQNTICR